MLKITFVGDIMCEKPLLKASVSQGNHYDFSDVFYRTKDLFADSTFLIGNLETPLAGEAAGYTQRLYSFNSPDRLAQNLKDAGFDLLSTANNHCLDRGIPGLRRTLNILDSIGIAHTGTWNSAQERKEAAYLTAGDGTTIAVIAYTYGTNYAVNHNKLSLEEEAMINLLHPYDEPVYDAVAGNGVVKATGRMKNYLKRVLSEEVKIEIKRMLSMDYNNPREDNYLDINTAKDYIERLRNDILSAKTKSDFLFFYPHIGGQFNCNPGSFTKYVIENALEFGVDAIIASHPHIIQKAEIINDVPCFYSVGNYSISPSSVYLLHENLPDYGLAVHCYIEKKMIRTTFSILKMVETRSKSLTVYSVEEYAERLNRQDEIETVKRNIKRIYRTVTGKELHENDDILRREYGFS